MASSSSRVNPWISTLILLGPPALFVFLDLGPNALYLAIGAYINITLVLNFIIGYGGCEVIALPTLIFRRRYTVYCPYNAVDAVERALIAGPTCQKIFGVVSVAVAAIVGTLLLLVDTIRMLQDFGFNIFINRGWALLLLIAIIFLARNAWVAYQHSDRRLSDEVRRYGIGALALLILTVIILFGLNWWLIWGLAMAAGGMIALLLLIRSAFGQSQPGLRNRA